jgi:hypothetical protein
MENGDETDREVHRFKRDYYERMDIDRLLGRLEHIAGRCERLKDPVKVGREVFDLYYQYLQVLETLFINAFALGKPERNFPAAIFIDSGRLKAFIEENFLKKTRYSEWFLANYVLWPHDDKGEEKVRRYENILMECAKDYIDNYQLLNAYKHGARVSAAAGDAYMSAKTPDGKVFRVADGDSSIVYYSKEKHEASGRTAIYERDLVFKRARVIGKTTFVITLLQNVRLMALKSLGVGTDKRQRYMYFEYDKQAWRESIGGYSFKQSLFSLQKSKKPRVQP